MYANLIKPFDEWTSLDFQTFMTHASEIAADGDIATKWPELRMIALDWIEAHKPEKMIADYR